MLPAINRTIGKNIGIPDVCMSPPPPPVGPVPVPYPNIADHGQAILFSVNVKVSGAPALHLGSKIPITSGDEGGTLHPFIKQIGQFTAGNLVVKINFLPGICLLCPSTGNNMNNGLGAAVVPPVVNVFYTYAEQGEPRDRALTRSDVDALAAELRGGAREGGGPVSYSLGSEGVGQLVIRVFSADVPARVLAAIEALLRGGMERLVIDLRDNPGGELTACAELLGDFLPAGTELFTLVDSGGDETVFRGWSERPHEFDVTVLVNGGTASAAELFASVLAAHGRAAVVGGPTFGKDTVQVIAAPPEGGAERVTVGRWRVRGEE